MAKHFNALGVLHIIYNSFLILGAVALMFGLVGAGQVIDDPRLQEYSTSIGVLVGIVMLLVAIPGVIGGIGLLQRQSWARSLVMIIGCANLLSFPFGTALGVYTIWVMIKPEAKMLTR